MLSWKTGSCAISPSSEAKGTSIRQRRDGDGGKARASMRPGTVALAVCVGRGSGNFWGIEKNLLVPRHPTEHICRKQGMWLSVCQCAFVGVCSNVQ